MNVRFGSTADIPAMSRDVRFAPKADILALRFIAGNCFFRYGQCGRPRRAAGVSKDNAVPSVSTDRHVAVDALVRRLAAICSTAT